MRAPTFAAAAATALPASAVPTQAQQYPQRPISMPLTAGVAAV
jgi:hypothetical protein